MLRGIRVLACGGGGGSVRWCGGGKYNGRVWESGEGNGERAAGEG
jgi:hypothetical protein